MDEVPPLEAGDTPRPDHPKWEASSRLQREAHAFKHAFQRKTVLDAGFPEEYAAKLEKNAPRARK
jgi:hypothetical protein